MTWTSREVRVSANATGSRWSKATGSVRSARSLSCRSISAIARDPLPRGPSPRRLPTRSSAESIRLSLSPEQPDRLEGQAAQRHQIGQASIVLELGLHARLGESHRGPRVGREEPQVLQGAPGARRRELDPDREAIGERRPATPHRARSARWWTRQERCRTAGEIELRCQILDSATTPVHVQIAPNSAHLKVCPESLEVLWTLVRQYGVPRQ